MWIVFFIVLTNMFGSELFIYVWKRLKVATVATFKPQKATAVATFNTQKVATNMVIAQFGPPLLLIVGLLTHGHFFWHHP
jgi:hypothetical protein